MRNVHLILKSPGLVPAMSSAPFVVSNSPTITRTSSHLGTSEELLPTTPCSRRSIGRSRTSLYHRLASKKKPFRLFLGAQPSDSNRIQSSSSCVSLTILRIQRKMEWSAPRTQAVGQPLRTRLQQRPLSKAIQSRIQQKMEPCAMNHQGNHLMSSSSASKPMRAKRELSWVEYLHRLQLRR